MTHSPRREPAELHEAFVWCCDECGQDNFVRAVTLEPGSDLIPESLRAEADADRAVRQSGVDDADAGYVFLTKPSLVTCENCGEEYDVAPDHP